MSDALPTPERLLRRPDVAKLCQLSERTLERLDSEGRGPRAVRIGKNVRYRSEDVRRWFEERTTR